jgi:cell division protein FtsI (penicillin-binding protein 3)
MTRVRLTLLFMGFALSSGLLIFRAFQLQVVPSKNVKRLASRQLHKTIHIVGRRGAIRDSEGRELAVSVNSSSIYLNPHLIKNPQAVVEALSKILEVPRLRIQDQLKRARGKRFVWLERQLDHKQMARLKRIGIEGLDGVGLLPEYRRDYPHASLAAHVLGFVSIDGNGLAGLEHAYDSTLVGGKKSFVVQRDARGRPIFGHLDQIRLEDMKGEDLTLTLDISLQARVERHLEEVVSRHEADAASAIVMNPNTGELLVLANYPKFDPNSVGRSGPQQRRNRVITDPIEPGSVVKPFVVARALEDRIVTPSSKVSGGGGTIRIGRKVISESGRRHRYDWMTVRDLIRYSSNVATVNLQQKMGFDKIADTYRRVGYGELTGLGLPAESRGIFRVPGPKQLLEQATMSYGHGMAATPLQVAVSYAVLANGGYRVTPRILRNSKNPPAEKGEKIFSDSTLKQVRSMLEAVVEDEGTGTLARIEGFRVAGKTGTSLKVDPKGGYMQGAYWSSFAGFFPSQDPEIVVYVMVDHPRKDGRYGSAVAAPLFADIVRSYLSVGASSGAAMLGQRRDSVEKNRAPATVVLGRNPMKEALSDIENKRMPDLVGMSLTEAMRILEQDSRDVEILQPGRVIYEQLPPANQALSGGERVRLRLR